MLAGVSGWTSLAVGPWLLAVSGFKESVGWLDQCCVVWSGREGRHSLSPAWLSGLVCAVTVLH